MVVGIIKHNYSFSIVEHEGIRDVFNNLNPNIKSYTRNTIKVDGLKIYKKKRLNMF